MENKEKQFPIDKQINKIIAIAKYKFQWKRKEIYNYCVESVPGCASRIDEKSQRNYSTSKLLSKLNSAEKSKIIQRLEQIEKRNLSQTKINQQHESEKI